MVNRDRWTRVSAVCPRHVCVRDSEFCDVRVRANVRGFKICDVRVRVHRSLVVKNLKSPLNTMVLIELFLFELIIIMLYLFQLWYFMSETCWSLKVSNKMLGKCCYCYFSSEHYSGAFDKSC